MEPEARQPSPNLATVAHLSSPKLRDASQKWAKVMFVEPEAMLQEPEAGHSGTPVELEAT